MSSFRSDEIGLPTASGDLSCGEAAGVVDGPTSWGSSSDTSSFAVAGAAPPSSCLFAPSFPTALPRGAAAALPPWHCSVFLVVLAMRIMGGASAGAVSGGAASVLPAAPHGGRGTPSTLPREQRRGGVLRARGRGVEHSALDPSWQRRLLSFAGPTSTPQPTASTTTTTPPPAARPGGAGVSWDAAATMGELGCEKGIEGVPSALLSGLEPGCDPGLRGVSGGKGQTVTKFIPPGAAVATALGQTRTEQDEGHARDVCGGACCGLPMRYDCTYSAIRQLFRAPSIADCSAGAQLILM